MPSTLKRSHRRVLVLTRSFTSAIQDKVQPRPRADGKECRPCFADRTNAHTPLSSTFDAPATPLLSSRPSMIFSLHHNANPSVPVHPVHRLPPELLVHVFALGSFDDTMFLVLVSHVCHSWRAIALHAHSLWRRVSLAPGSNVDMWKERIRRARLCTLDVVLSSHPPSRSLYDIDIVALQMHLLAPHAPALRSLDIHFDSYAPYLWNAALSPFCRPTSYSWGDRSPNLGNRAFRGAVEAPKLESLALRYPQNDDIKEFALFGGSAPRLARVTLEGVRLTWLPELFGNLSFLDYTHHGFSSGDKAVDEILFMLRISSQIRELKLCICHRTLPFQASHLRMPLIGDNSVTVLPRLETLSLCVDNGDSDIPSELITLLSRLSTPRVVRLSLEDRTALSGQHPRPFAGLPTFVDTIGCNTSLCELIAGGRWVGPSLMFGLPARLPSLNSVRVGNMVSPEM